MAIQLIVFDIAGTTLADNYDVHRVLQKALAADEITISIEDANAVMGIPKPVAIRSLLEKRYAGSLAIDEDWIQTIHARFVNEMIHFYKTDPGVHEKAGVSETFFELKKRNIKVVVDTGFDRKITDAILERVGWKHNVLIDASVASDEVANGRPYPDMIFKAMKLTEVTSVAHVAKVGDTPSDLQQGSAAGCRLVVGVTTGAFSREELAKEEHTHLIENIGDLLKIVDELM